ALDLGVNRLVIGTQALKRPDWFAAMSRRFPGRLLLGLDAKHGQVATDGWLEVSTSSAVEVARRFEDLPLAGLIYTDISRAGMFTWHSGLNTISTRKQWQSIRSRTFATSHWWDTRSPGKPPWPTPCCSRRRPWIAGAAWTTARASPITMRKRRKSSTPSTPRC